jgi:hypothetical protein
MAFVSYNMSLDVISQVEVSLHKTGLVGEIRNGEEMVCEWRYLGCVQGGTGAWAMEKEF